MRIFVGTLYTIENEFEDCVASIRNQDHSNYSHFVFRDLPNKVAHETLYRSFMNAAEEYDLLIKVDADMVLNSRHLFRDIESKFSENRQLKDLEIAVFDYMSDQLIWGLHAYRNSVKWRFNADQLFVDRSPVKPNERMHDDTELAPAAIHCGNPAPFQAFHYGVHKALKTIQPGRRKKHVKQMKSHWRNLERIRHHFRTTEDDRIGLAVLGAELAFKGGIKSMHLDYNNPYLRELSEPYLALSGRQLRRAIASNQLRNYGFLPARLRLKALLRRFGSKGGAD